MKNKFFKVVICTLLVLTTVSTNVFAEETDYESEIKENMQEIVGTIYSNFKNAVDAKLDDWGILDNVHEIKYLSLASAINKIHDCIINNGINMVDSGVFTYESSSDNGLLASIGKKLGLDKLFAIAGQYNANDNTLDCGLYDADDTGYDQPISVASINIDGKTAIIDLPDVKLSYIDVTDSNGNGLEFYVTDDGKLEVLLRDADKDNSYIEVVYYVNNQGYSFKKIFSLNTAQDAE